MANIIAVVAVFEIHAEMKAVTAPETPGDYILEFDMTQEGVAWFGAHGSKPLRARVKVLPGG